MLRQPAERRRMSEDRFVPSDGRPLTPYEREILTILQEECAEVIVAASKLLRFGVGNTNPSTGKKNDEDLGLEVGDLQQMIDKIIFAEIVSRDHLIDGMVRKQDRLIQFMQHAPERRHG